MATHSRFRAALLLTLLIVSQGGAPTHSPPVRAPHPGPSTSPAPDSVDELGALALRMDAVEAQGHGLLTFHQRRIIPIITLLRRRSSASPASVERLALALVREGRASGVDARLLAAVLVVENPWLDPSARSPVGAVGLMQVMPFHAGRWGCSGDDLEHPETNICHGAKILAEAIRRSRDLDTALLRYNGCRYGTNTPDCHEYPRWVQARAGPAWMAEIDAGLPARSVDSAEEPTS